MSVPSRAQAEPRPGSPRRFGGGHLHRAWLVAAITFLALVSAAAFRSSTGVLIEPVEAEFGWSRSWTSAAVAVNLALFGLTAPFAAALMERFGIRRVVAVALTLISLGSGLTVVMHEPWQLVLLWGFVVGTGAGSMALVTGAIVAGRWFRRHRGLVTGLFSASSASGQLVFLPLISRLAVDHGWRSASLLTSGLALAMVPLVLGLLADSPAKVGLRPYGDDDSTAPAADPPRERLSAPRELRLIGRDGTFWMLAFGFFVCGWSTNGLVGTHFVAAAHDHGMPPTTAATLLALVGICDIVGTLASGWLSDRVDSRILLAVYYGLRALSLLAVPMVLGPHADAPVMFFVIFYGLDWVATVPPVVALTRQYAGPRRTGVVFGWIYAAHMLGAAVAAQYAGVIRQLTGSYSLAWWTAGALCLAAAAVSLQINPERRASGGTDPVPAQLHPDQSAQTPPGQTETGANPMGSAPVR